MKDKLVIGVNQVGQREDYGEHLFDHHLYLSHHYTFTFTNYIYKSNGPLWAAFVYCINTCLSNLWLLLMVPVLKLCSCVSESHIL